MSPSTPEDSSCWTPISPSTLSVLTNISFSSFTTASTPSSCTSTSSNLTRQEDLKDIIPSGAVTPLPSLPHPPQKRESSLTKRRGYDLSINIHPHSWITTDAKGALEPRVGALPRRRRKRATSVPVALVIYEAEQFDFTIA